MIISTKHTKYFLLSVMAVAIFTVASPALAALDFSIGVTPNQGIVDQGQWISFVITASDLGGSNEAVGFSINGMPTPSQAIFSSSYCTPTCSTLVTLYTYKNDAIYGTTPDGKYTLTIEGWGVISQSIVKTASYALIVSNPEAGALSTRSWLQTTDSSTASDGFNLPGNSKVQTGVRGTGTGAGVGLGYNKYAVSLGDDHSCALSSGGTVKCWGRNDSGQLGDGTAIDKTTPIAVSNINGGVIALLAGNHTCAAFVDGTAKCWGNNGSGQLGDGTTINRLTPVTVSGLSGAVAITSGYYHTCAALNDGTAKCWGRNNYSQLGDGSTTDSTTPVFVSGLGDTVAVEAGSGHTCAVLSDGTAKCWGNNGSGQLGDGTTTSRSTLVAVFEIANAVAMATSDYNHNCAIINDGTAKCWGNNYYGQLGDSSTTNRPSPVSVSNFSNGFVNYLSGTFSSAIYDTTQNSAYTNVAFSSTVPVNPNQWTQTTDADFSGGTNASTTVSGTGNSASIILPSGYFYVTNNSSNTISKVSNGAGQVAATYNVGINPAGIAVGQNYVWSANFSASSVSRIDPASGNVSSFSLAIRPVALAASPVDGYLYVMGASGTSCGDGTTNYGYAHLVRVDQTTGQVLNTLTSTQCVATGSVGSAGLGIAINQNNIAYVPYEYAYGAQTGIFVHNLSTFSQVTKITINR